MHSSCLEEALLLVKMLPEFSLSYSANSIVLSDLTNDGVAESCVWWSSLIAIVGGTRTFLLCLLGGVCCCVDDQMLLQQTAAMETLLGGLMYTLVPVLSEQRTRWSPGLIGC